MKPLGVVAAEFDGIAAAIRAEPHHEHLPKAERLLFERVPSSARTALDVGCGEGTFARMLARRGVEVLALDISPEMIALARDRTTPDLSVTYRVGDIMREALPGQTFDVVVSVNMVHHVSLKQIVPKLAELVAPGGTLLIQDVVTRGGIRYFPKNVYAFLVRRFGRLRRFASLRWNSGRVQSLFDAHGNGETYLTPDQAETAYAQLLSGAVIAHDLEWRYSLCWKRPAADA